MARYWHLYILFTSVVIATYLNSTVVIEIMLLSPKK